MSDENGLPKDQVAERAAIASALIFPDCWPIVARTATADFTDPALEAFHRGMMSLQQRGEPIDARLLASELKDDKIFDGNAAGAILELADTVATGAHAEHYVARVLEASRKRRAYLLFRDAQCDAMNGKPLPGILDDTRTKLDELRREAAADGPRDKFVLGDLCDEYPTLNPPVVEGLFRERETCNVISVSKAGKSWLGYGLALSVITGQEWLGRFRTTAGRVLLIDNELHRSTLAHRIPAVGDAMGLPPEWYMPQFDIWALRGNLRSLADLATEFEDIEAGAYKLIILDAKYRFVAPGASENDNAAETATYNLIDQIAERTGAAVVLIHHSSKGSQSDKRVTDVGAGAGAQSRAADCHLILREHEDPDVVVLEAAVRSFAPVEPLALRWTFPLWTPTDADPAKLRRRTTASEQQQADRDREGINKILAALRAGPATARNLRSSTGLSHGRQQRLLDQLESEGHIIGTETKVGGNLTREYSITKQAE